MGRGGKKKDKKGKENVGESGDVPSMSSLSISESQPSTSTSQEGTSAPERDPVADAPSATAAAPPPATAAKAPPPQEEEEEDGLGLGLGGGKKKRPRKKKAGDKPAAPATGPAPGSAQPAAATSPPLGAPTPTGLGPAWAAPTAKPGWPAPAPSPGPSSAQQAGPPPGFQAPGPPPKADFPGMGGRPQSTPYAGPPPGFKAAEQVRSPGPQQSSSFAPPPAEQTTKPVQVLLPPVEGHRGRGDSRSSESPLCIYKIPLKIVGNKVMGRKVNVQTNYLPMNIKPMKIHRYDVTFNPDKPKKLLPKAYAASKRKHFPNNLIAFDQMKNIYTLTALPGVDKINRFATNVEFTDDNGKTMNFEVSYKFTGIVDLSTILKYMQNQGTSLNPPTEAIQCVDVILRQGTLESYIKAGRQFFKRPANPIDLGDGFEMWTGLFQSAIFTSRPFVNIDVAHKGFPKEQPLIQAMEKAFRLSIDKPIENQRGRNVDAFKMFIKGLKVVANIGGDVSRTGQRREFICNELVNSPDRIMFTCKDEKTQKEDRMSVLHYFENVKKIRIRYPKLNCMWVGPKDKHIYYPLELLTVSYGQPMNKQLNEIQLATMVREAATPPHERKRKIEEVIKDMNYSQNNYFKQFGLEIKNEFLTVEAKVLTPPRLDVGLPGKPVNPMKGQWMTSNLQTAQMLDSWGLIAIELDPNIIDANNFVSQITVVGNQMGMKVNNPKFQEFNVSMYKLNEMLDRAFKEKLKVLFVIVTGRGKDYYHRVKQIAECEIGVLTQCIKENTCARRMNQQTAKNILLKVNSKLMGVNQSLETMPACIARGGVMIVGADVTHPSPDQTSVPSIAAVTASMDTKCYRYNIQLSIQTPKKEVIVEFEDMMVEHLQVFRRIQKALPKKIFVFRDGVSEGQFAEVMNSELAAVHKAYQRLAGPDGKPEVLFLLVQKRHHTRFFTMPASQNNVEPGTVVDTQIVHSSELDFYLVSHQAIKGTARPTRYHAVCNDGKIPHDEVEQLTFYLCHLYSRCMRSVSYPTPTYYAHLACLRARSLTYGQKFDNDALEKQPQRLNVLDKMLNASRMFFV